jgi:hypothetical protein
MSKKVYKNNDQEDYEKSGFKATMNNLEKTKNEGLEPVPQVPAEQVPTNGETTEEIIFGDSENNTILEKNVNSEDKNKIISEKISKFGKGFKIPDDKTNS